MLRHVINRPVIGTWDDHDAGVNDGNSLFPPKLAFKKLFLDAMGEPLDSPRCSTVSFLDYSNMSSFPVFS